MYFGCCLRTFPSELPDDITVVKRLPLGVDDWVKTGDFTEVNLSLSRNSQK